MGCRIERAGEKADLGGFSRPVSILNRRINIWE